jgi:2-C-methyl-D-erythritol 4-phosphate cytidylyltransferase
MASFAVILAAAGKSNRFHDPHYKKPFVPLAERAVWLHSAEKFINRDDVQQLVVVISADDRESFMSKFGANVAILGIDVVEGGATRSESVRNGLQAVREEMDFVIVHDAARPCLATVWIDELISTVEKTGAVTMGIPVVSTLKRVADGNVQETVARDQLWESQTPQAFRRQLLVDAFAQPSSEDRKVEAATDEAQLVEWLGHPVTMISGSPLNRKITTKEDLRFAAMALKALPKPKLNGPAHPFADDMWR